MYSYPFGDEALRQPSFAKWFIGAESRECWGFGCDVAPNFTCLQRVGTSNRHTHEKRQPPAFVDWGEVGSYDLAWAAWPARDSVGNPGGLKPGHGRGDQAGSSGE